MEYVAGGIVENEDLHLRREGVLPTDDRQYFGTSEEEQFASKTGATAVASSGDRGLLVSVHGVQPGLLGKSGLADNKVI